MAFAVPVVMAFEAVAAAGSLAAAVSTVGGFLAVAGGVLAGVGALTGKKDLVKLGGLMSLGSALGSMAGSASAAAGEAAGASGAQEAFRAAELAQQPAVETAFSQAASASGAGTQSLFERATNMGSDFGALNEASAGLVAESAPQSILNRVMEQRPAFDYGSKNVADMIAGSGGGQATDIVQRGAAGMTSNDLSATLKSGWERTQALLGNIGQAVEKYPNAFKIGASVIGGMYGPEAEKLDLGKSILARRLRNLNSPVALGNAGGG